MKLTAGMLYYFIKLFGLKHGLKLFTHLKLNSLNYIKLPNVQSEITLRKGTSDIQIFDQIFIHPEYDISFATTPQIIIDGGANIGLFTVLMKNKFPDAKIISVEPDAENFELLKKNVTGYKDVICENCGIWNKAANLKVYDKFEAGKWGMVVEESMQHGTVKAISINDIMQKYSIERIDLLKLDIETSEKQVFLNNYENWLPKTKMIIIELHDWMEEGCAKPFFEAINKSITNYKYLVNGQNTIIINNDIA